MQCRSLLLQIRLHGPFQAGWSDDHPLDLRNVKAKALLALLATAPDGQRSRSWLQDMLWSRSEPEHGRASLRQCLAALRRSLGDRFETHFETTNEIVRLRLDRVDLVGDRADGEFLEGVDVRSEGFETWLRERRTASPAPEPVPVIAPQALRLHPCIVVVPFRTVGDDPTLRTTGDLLAQDITRTLSRSSLFDVICHLSSRSLPNDTIDLGALRTLLDVDVIVCGHLRPLSDGIRLDVDFLEAASGRLCLSRSYTARTAEIAAGMTDLVASVAEEVTLLVARTTVELIANRQPREIEAHRLLMAAVMLMHRVELRSFSRARVFLEELVVRMPQQSEIHAWLAKWYALSMHQGWSTDRVRDARTARTHAITAREINPLCPLALTMDGLVQGSLLRHPDEAEALFDEALSLDPNNALAALQKGIQHAFVGDGENAIAWTTRARRLSPLDPHRYYFDALSASAHVAADDDETGLALAERSLKANRRHTSTLRTKVVALQKLGRHEEARLTAIDLMRREPELTIERYLRHHPAADYETGRVWASALKDAGVPAR